MCGCGMNYSKSWYWLSQELATIDTRSLILDLFCEKGTAHKEKWVGIVNNEIPENLENCVSLITFDKRTFAKIRDRGVSPFHIWHPSRPIIRWDLDAFLLGKKKVSYIEAKTVLCNDDWFTDRAVILKEENAPTLSFLPELIRSTTPIICPNTSFFTDYLGTGYPFIQDRNVESFVKASEYLRSVSQDRFAMWRAKSQICQIMEISSRR